MEENNNSPKGDNGNSDKNKKYNRFAMIICLVLACSVVMTIIWIQDKIQENTNIEVSYDEFIEMLEDDEIEEVLITNDRIEIKPVEQPEEGMEVKYYTGFLSDGTLIDRLEAAGVSYKREVQETTNSIIEFFETWVMPFVLIAIVMAIFYRMIAKGGMMGVGKSNAKVYVEKKTGVTFADVAGQEEAKESMLEIVDFLHNPEKYSEIGAKLPRGALLVGPPGTGKTLLAKAVAGEAEVPFFSLSGSDFVEMFVGVGASRVRDLFKQAQQMAPCIIFIDEIDAIGKSRDNRYGGGNDEREQTLNQLLSEMDGFDTSKGLVVLAATNRPEILDKALLRPGRFDRRIIVEKPDLNGRIDVLKVHSKDVNLDESVDLKEIALATSGAVGADLANMINEAAIMAVKDGRKFVNQADLFEAVEVVIAGKEKKDKILSDKEKKIVAYHECGHALVACIEKNSEPVQKITIIPRTKGSLGYVMLFPEEEKQLESKEELIARIVGLMGGRAAEEVVFNSVTGGAANDIEQATNIARAMVTRLGMSERFGLMGLETVEDKYLSGRPVLNCGDETASMIDEEVHKIIDDCYKKAVQIMTDNKVVLDSLAKYLYEHETITGKQFMDIYREITGIQPDEDKDILDL